MKSSPGFESKLPKVEKSIFSYMSQLAREYNAINLAQGFPDFKCADELVELVSYYMRKGFNQYAPLEGILPLREKISLKTQSIYGVSYNPLTEITVTAGATEGVYSVVSAVVKQGDEVIIFEPAFDSYTPAVEFNGGIPVYIHLNYPEYKIDWNLVGSKITSRTKLIILNSPHNPTGSVLYKKDIEALTNLVKDTNILLLSDEVYEHIIFEGLKHESFILYPELRERSFILSSFGKTFHTTGWRMGYCLAPETLTKEMRKVHQYVTFSAATPMQYALADFLENKEHYLSLPDFFQKKRDKFLQLMSGSKFEFIPSKGTYFQLFSYKNITNESDIIFAEKLVKEIGVAGIPLSVFYDNKRDEHIIRFCFAKEDETLEKAAEKLCRI